MLITLKAILRTLVLPPAGPLLIAAQFLARRTALPVLVSGTGLRRQRP